MRSGMNSVRADIENRNIADNKHIIWDELLGTGQFGNVHKAYLGAAKIQVAIKVCKDKDTSKLLQEAKILEQCSHPHIIHLISVRNEAFIMEFAKYGALKPYILQNKSNLSFDTLLMFIHQLAMALAYLEEMKYIHRDIAIRNVLVFEPDCVKLADFGMARYLGDDIVYIQTELCKLPIKWMSPESLTYRVFNTKSDVWMFGVCMWEILSLGEKPFKNITNDEFQLELDRGLRLKAPKLCTRALEEVMMSCWASVPRDRPSFRVILKKISSIISERKLLWGSKIEKDCNIVVPYKCEAFDSMDDYVVDNSNPQNVETYESKAHAELVRQFLVKQQEESAADALWLQQAETKFNRQFGSK